VRAAATSAPAAPAAGAHSPHLPPAPASVLTAALPQPPRGVPSAKPAAPFSTPPPLSPAVALLQQATPAPLPRDALKPQPPPGSRLARPTSEDEGAGTQVSPPAVHPRPPPTPAPPAARLAAAPAREPSHGKLLPLPSGDGAVVFRPGAATAPVAAAMLRPQPPPPRSARSTS
jgi:hypothetical protein